ncbi:hypothetical protein SUGI_0721530 [Cryptomeria japonica]|nr:hypothetical protein SUGI_0721530 [Cryptomeria japonica]
MDWNEKLVNESYEWIEKLNPFKERNLLTWNFVCKDGLLEAGVVAYNGYSLDHLEGTKISASIFDKNGKRHTTADLLRYVNPENNVVLLNAIANKILFNLESGKVKASGLKFTSNNNGLS